MRWSNAVCRCVSGTYLKGVERIDVSSTSRAAEMVKEDTSGTSAAIASSLAAEIHGLDALAKGIEDREDNKTRFLIIRKLISPQIWIFMLIMESLIFLDIEYIKIKP